MDSLVNALLICQLIYLCQALLYNIKKVCWLLGDTEGGNGQYGICMYVTYMKSNRDEFKIKSKSVADERLLEIIRRVQ